MPKFKAILLLGPTGAGKSPLGDELEKRGFRGRRCFHFDFGAELRAAAVIIGKAYNGDDDGLSDSDRAVIRRVLETGALLEDSESPIAWRVFRRFVRTRGVRPDNWIVLNGLPRHIGQARGLSRDVDIRLVVVLHAAPSVIRERIRTNIAGDRTNRIDDRPADIEAKLGIFEDRTRPLIDFFAARGAEIVRIEVDREAAASTVAESLQVRDAETEAPASHRALRLVSLAIFLASSTWFSGTAAAPALKSLWRLGNAQSVWLTISVQLGFVAGTFVYAVFNLADIFPARRVFAFSALAGAAGNAAFALLANGFGSGLAFRFLTGVSLAGVYPVGMKIVAQWHRTGLGRHLSRLTAALTLGSSLPFLLFAAGGRLAPRPLLLAASMLAAGGAALVGWGLGDGPYLRAAAPFDWKAAARMFRIRAFRRQAFGYFGHMWELYAFWSLSAGFWGAALAGAPWAGGGSLSLIIFLIFLAGAVGCLAAGAASRRFGELAAARAALWISGLCCALSPFIFELPSGVIIPCALVWGAAVIADSAQFSGLAAGVCEPAYTGTALTVQNGIGFALTVVSIQLVSAAAPLLGWRWAFLLLLPGPIVGAWALTSLRREDVPPAGPAV
jgi:adenylate kinase family enzyme/MFS family permease